MGRDGRERSSRSPTHSCCHVQSRAVVCSWCSRVQSCAVACSRVQSSVVVCSRVQSSAVVCSRVQSRAVACSCVQLCAVVCSRVQSCAVVCSRGLGWGPLEPWAEIGW